MYEFRRSPRLYTKRDLESGRRLPGFVCIGAPKCATTWLFQCLHEHPDVFVPDFKEINFFTVSRWGDDYETKGIDYYARMFATAGPEHVIGDFSPNLLEDPFAPERVQALIPEARFIVMLRNPIERSRSHFHYVRNRTHRDGYSLLEILADPSRDPAGFLWQGLYGQQLENWFERFDRVRFLVVESEVARTRPQQLFADVCRFIGVDEGFLPPSLSIEANASRSLRAPLIYTLNLRVSRFLATHRLDGLRTLLKRVGVARIIQRLNEVPTKNPPLTPAEARELAAFYREDTARLSRLLGRDYSGWLEGYPDE